MKDKIENRVKELEQARTQIAVQLNAIDGALLELKALLVEPVDETTNKGD